MIGNHVLRRPVGSAIGAVLMTGLMTGLAACSPGASGPHPATAFRPDAGDSAGGRSTGGARVVGRVTWELAVPDVFDVDVRGGSIWATVPGRERLLRLDRRTGERVASIRVGAGPLDGVGLSFVAASPGAVWVTVPQEDLLARVDPRTNAVVDRIHVGGDPWGVDADASAVWVAVHHGSKHGQAARVDPDTDRIVARVPLGPATQGPGHVTIARDAVWVGVDGDHLVARIDPRTDRVVAEVAVDGGCGGLDAGRSVWVSGRICGAHVTRIDPGTNKVTAEVALPGISLGLAILRGSVWVADVADGHGALFRIDERTGAVLGQVTLDHAVGTLAVADTLYAAGGGTIIRVEPLEDQR